MHKTRTGPATSHVGLDELHRCVQQTVLYFENVQLAQRFIVDVPSSKEVNSFLFDEKLGLAPIHLLLNQVAPQPIPLIPLRIEHRSATSARYKWEQLLSEF